MAKKIYFLAPYPEGSAPSQRFRFEQYFNYLRQQGYKLEVYPFYDYDTWQTLYKDGKYLLKSLKVTYCFLKRFGLPVESNIQYPGPDPKNSIESQYNRPLSLPKG